jgi:hypothetical protein
MAFRSGNTYPTVYTPTPYLHFSSRQQLALPVWPPVSLPAQSELFAASPRLHQPQPPCQSAEDRDTCVAAARSEFRPTAGRP